MPASILVVDDEPAIVQVLDHLLADEGYRVTRASDGVEAWREIQRAAPDLLITDVMMPNLSGIALIRIVRDHGHDFPVVMISAHAARMNDPRVHHVRKPFDINELLAIVERLLRISSEL